jgi:hypothetical protein
MVHVPEQRASPARAHPSVIVALPMAGAVLRQIIAELVATQHSEHVPAAVLLQSQLRPPLGHHRHVLLHRPPQHRQRRYPRMLAVAVPVDTHVLVAALATAVQQTGGVALLPHT